MADDPDFVELLEMFVEGIGEKKTSLLDASRGGDFESIRKVAHQLKGSGGGYGFPGITEHALALEMSVKESLGPDVVAERMQVLLAYLDRVVV
ncbi:MAG: Hpt domain-containing protein [Planctomycetales bacterium]